MTKLLALLACTGTLAACWGDVKPNSTSDGTTGTSTGTVVTGGTTTSSSGGTGGGNPSGACQTDEDCPMNFFCDDSTGTCVADG